MLPLFKQQHFLCMLKEGDIVCIERLSPKSIAYYDRIKADLDKCIVCPCHIDRNVSMKIVDVFKNKFCLCLTLDDRSKLTLIHMSDLRLF